MSEKCQKCEGLGFVVVDGGYDKPDYSIDCPVCGGSGKLEV